MEINTSIIRDLLNKKAEENNTIDLNAYALGLTDMFNALNMQPNKCNVNDLDVYGCKHWKNQERGCFGCNKQFEKNI